jgi:hypothetical protein
MYDLTTGTEDAMSALGLQPPRVLRRALKKTQSAGGAVTDTVQPEPALPNTIQQYRTRAAEAYRTGQEMMNREPDMTALQDYAKQRSQQGDSDMLNALAAQYAGERFQPVQAKYLKRAAAAREPIKAGSGFITPDGQYIQDPSAGQDKRAEFLLNMARQYETLAQTAETAQERAEAQRAQNEINNELRRMALEIQRQGQQLRANGGGGASPYFQPIQTAQGMYAFNSRTGRVEPVMGDQGQQLLGMQADPALQGQIAGAKSGASTSATLEAKSRFDAPKAIAEGEEAIRLVDDLLAAPGFGTAVGSSRMLGIQKIPGTSAKDFDIRLDQLRGKQFLQAFESLKGGGQITEIEGKKATEAIARMDAAGSEPEFINAAREFQNVIRAGVERARAASANSPRLPSAPKRIRFDAQGNVIP